MKFSFKRYLENRTYWGSQGAGILAFAEDTNKWLVALRSSVVKEPNTWGVVGGKLDERDDSPQEAAQREFEEETGYSGPIKLQKAYIYTSQEKNRNTGNPFFTYHNFIGIIQKGSWEPKLNWETKLFDWFDYKELMELEPKHFGLKSLLANSYNIIKDISIAHERSEKPYS